MSTNRIKQVNELLRSELAKLVHEHVHLGDALATIRYVDCSSDLKSAKIAISVLPENVSLSTLKKIKKHSGVFSRFLKKKLNLKNIPKFKWVIDYTESKASEIDDILDKIGRGEL